MYVSEIIQWCFAKTNISQKQSSKVQKVITLRFVFAFFNSNTTYKKLDEEQKFVIDDLVLVIVKGLFSLNIVENIHGWSDLVYERTHDCVSIM